MSSPGYATPLALEPRRSRWLLSLMLVMHLGAVGAMLALDEWPWGVRLVLGGGVLLSLWRVLRAQGWAGRPPALRRLTWSADDEWRLETNGGEVLSARLSPPSLVHPWLVVLNLRPAGRRRSRPLVLFPDSLDAASFRRLRVRLRVESGAGEGGDA